MSVRVQTESYFEDANRRPHPSEHSIHLKHKAMRWVNSNNMTSTPTFADEHLSHEEQCGMIMEQADEQFETGPRRSSRTGLIIRQKDPPNLEMPFEQLDSYLTPTELFYIRSHFPTPRIDVATYRLVIDGAVRKPLALSYEELRNMPTETRIATLECAGNGRVFLVPQVRGAQWQLGAVGNAEWTGVPLRALMERAELEDDACEVVLEGADRGIPAEEPKPPGPISYARSVSRKKAAQPEVLIAFQMNGRDLSGDHGYRCERLSPVIMAWLPSNG
jgi:DMSO/TMAO reductase YedYZ molybdopterin-dependent catalytic subunit